MPVLQEIGKHTTSYVTISKDEYDSMKRTLDILSDKELMEQLRESKNAKSRPWKQVKKELCLWNSFLCLMASIETVFDFSSIVYRMRKLFSK